MERVLICVKLAREVVRASVPQAQVYGRFVFSKTGPMSRYKGEAV